MDDEQAMWLADQSVIQDLIKITPYRSADQPHIRRILERIGWDEPYIRRRHPPEVFRQSVRS